MSAVAAVFMRDGRPPESIAEMSAALHRFGDKSVVRKQGPTGLARVVSAPFTPEDAFDRYIVECEDGQVVAFHGMLHHRDELARALDVAPQRARRLADSDLFARAWQRWGEAAAARAEGEFAVVVWDGARRVLTALCSPLSSPPLYFSVTPQAAVVASAPRGVHAGSGIPRRLNDAHLASGLILNYFDVRSTYFEGVQALGCGEVLTVEAEPGTHRIRRFWNTADHVRPVRMRRTEEYVEAGREVLGAAVAESMRACETPAMLLSSGLDSTTVAASALEQLAETSGAAPLISFTYRPASGWDGRTHSLRFGDEGPLVRAMADKYPALDARFVHAKDIPWDHLWRPMMELHELPERNTGNIYWGHECKRRIRAAGRRVVMNGASGNATISYMGLERFATWFRHGRWEALNAEAALLPPWVSKKSFLLHRAVLPFLPHSLYVAQARWSGRLGWPAYSAVHPDFARDMRVDQRAREHGFSPHFRCARSRLEGQLKMLFSFKDGEVRSVRLAAEVLHDVTGRDPLANRRLALWCLGLPDELYYRDGCRRRLVRLLMDGRLPHEILWATRRGLQTADWHFRLARDLPRLREEIEEWRGDPAVAERLDLDRLLRVLNTWPSETPLSQHDHPDWHLLPSGFYRAVTTGRFIRFVENG